MYQGYNKVKLKVTEDLDIEFNLALTRNATKLSFDIDTFQLINVNRDSIARLAEYNYDMQARIIRLANEAADNYMSEYKEQLLRDMAGAALYA